MRLPWSRRAREDADGGSRADAGTPVPAVPSGDEAAQGAAAGAQGDDRFRPGGMDPQAARAYADSVEETAPGLGSEDPALRRARLARRRRLLALGGVPALLGLLAAGWLAMVGALTLAGHHATVRQDHGLAVDRYAAVERIDPWLERWRVLYNLGTAEALAERPEDAVGHLEAALETVPRAEMDSEGNLPAGSPECLVRGNLYAVYQLLASGTADEQAAAGYLAQAESVAATCPVPEPQQPATAPPSGPPSGEPSGEPSGQPSGEPSGSATPSPDPSASGEASPTPSPSASPSDPKEDELRDRNGGANETAPPRNGVSGSGKRW